MGYTNYWSGPRVITEDALADIEKIIAESGVPITGWNGEEGTEPTLTLELININGVGDDSHENFGVSAEGRGDIDWGFCKTARKPYDKVVGAILLRIREDSPQFIISSDGRWGTEWRAARRLFTKVTGRDPIPWN
ncbi:hypothetical protein SEA_BIG4_343 [Microbacterium phage Big4]|nr:hypothetical protein SEA_BIG4_17 [Microbacterium phage Big4]URP22376.1 hypothetical protein SEA_BIG4_343 [Microbacterium phage Big4]